MKPDYNKYQKNSLGKVQGLPSYIFLNNVPEPTLWNSALGRRQFLGKIGKAGVGVVIVANTLKLDVLGSESAVGWVIDRDTIIRYTYQSSEDVTLHGSGSGASALAAKRDAITALKNSVGAPGGSPNILVPGPPDNPHLDKTTFPWNYVVTGVETTVTPQISGDYNILEAGPDPFGSYVCEISLKVRAGTLTTWTQTITYGPPAS